jgi:uncharacterized membrane protein YedE/YeeE
MAQYLLQTGYPFEFAGLIYFLFYISMSRAQNKDRFSQRSKVFTLIASMVLVGSVPFGYGGQPAAIALMLGLVAIAIWSTWSDRRTPPPAR